LNAAERRHHTSRWSGGPGQGLLMKRGRPGQSASEFWRKQIGDFIDVLGRAVFEKFARRLNETLETSCFCNYCYEQNCVVFGTVIFTHEDLSHWWAWYQ
jgi:hypothetical protein